MSVDGIGSGGGRPIRGPTGGDPVKSPAAAETGPVGGAARGEAPQHAEATTPLAELERGAIDLDRYLDTRVAEATRHLEGRLPIDQLEFVKSSLREQLSTDPVLVELVRRTTGALPTPRVE